MTAKPGLVLFHPYMEVMAGAVAERFELLRMWEEPDLELAIDRKCADAAAILTTGQDYAVDERLLSRLPGLRLVVAVGSGYASVDVAAARARGVVVANAGDTHSGDVAEHAVTLALALVRDLFGNDRYVRDGTWLEKGYPPHHRAISTERFGILGLGRIGTAIAERLEPFGGEIAWWGPGDKPAAWPRCSAPLDLARWCTVLLVAARGDALGLVDQKMVEAVGPNGYIINVSRGGVMDEDALIAALREGRLAGAALDVFRDEPTPPERWRDVPNVILSAHMAGQTTNAMARLREAAGANLNTVLDGGPVVNEIVA
jgi:hydroxypyruvate reductase